MKSARVTSGVTEHTISGSAVFRVRRNTVSWRPEDEGVVVYDVERDIVYEGNRTALLVIERCDGRTTVGNIAAHLADRYRVPFPQILDDVRGFVGQVAKWGLLEQVG